MKIFYRLLFAMLLYTGAIFAQGAGSALDFESTSSQFVSCTTDNIARISGDITLESWINPETIQTQTLIYCGGGLGETQPDNTLYTLQINADGTLTIAHEHTAGVDQFVTSVGTVSAGVWTHVAVTRNVAGATNEYQFYFNGISEAAGTYTTDPDGGSNAYVRLGAATSGAAVFQPMDGLMDEIRIWFDIRTETEIRDNMNKKVSTGDGLVACWRMDDGGTSQTVTDLTGDNSGTRGVDGGAAGDDPAWATSTAPIGDESVWTATATNIALIITNEDIVTLSNIGGTVDPDFVALIRVDEAPNLSGVSGNLHHVDPLRYYEAWMSGGTAPDYDFNYTFTGHPGITNENTLEIGLRSDASVAVWSDGDADNPVQGILVLADQTVSRQYILASENTDNPLPIQLTTFTAHAGDQRIILKWETASELNNQGFIILGSAEKFGQYKEISSYISNDELKGAGNSSNIKKYTFTDRFLHNGMTYYYKLVDVSLDGRRFKHGLIASATPRAKDMEIITDDKLPNEFALLQNYPNPFNPSTYIKFVIPELSDEVAIVNLSIFNLLGEKVKTLYSGTLAPRSNGYGYWWHGLNDANQPVPSGVYIYQLSSTQDNARFFKSMKMLLIK